MSASADVMPRGDRDLADCVAALHESHLVDRYPMIWPDDPALWLSPPRALGAWIASWDGAVVGHVVLVERDSQRAEISRLFVAPRAQRTGLAMALLDAATGHAAATGRRVELNVVEDSEAAIRLYERLGWTLLGRKPAPFVWPDGSRPIERRYAAPGSVRDARPMEPCIACDLLAGRVSLPGGLIHRTTSWVVEHCVGPLGVGTLIVKPVRHVVGVDELTDEEAVELGPLLREASRVARALTGAEQVYNCLWSHAGGHPGHVHYVIQPVTAEQVAEREAYGPALQMAMFVENRSPDAHEVEAFAERARRMFGRQVPEPEGVEPSTLTWPECAPSSGPVVLRPFCPDDVAMARDMATDPYAPLIGTLPADADEAQALAWIERQPERFSSGAGYSFAIAEADSGTALGVIGMMLRKHGRASVGYTVAPRARGRGAAGHGLRALCEFAWTLPELFRLEAYIEPWNTASIRTVEFAGFEREGVLRSYMGIGEPRRDMAIYSCLREEPDA